MKKTSSYEVVQCKKLVDDGLNSGQSICSHGNWASVDNGNDVCKRCGYHKNEHTIGFEYEEYELIEDTKIDFDQKERYDKCVAILEKSLPNFTTAVNEYQGLF